MGTARVHAHVRFLFEDLLTVSELFHLSHVGQPSSSCGLLGTGRLLRNCERAQGCRRGPMSHTCHQPSGRGWPLHDTAAGLTQAKAITHMHRNQPLPSLQSQKIMPPRKRAHSKEMCSHATRTG